MLKAVIFDMDGVVVDSDRMLFTLERKVFEDLGIAVSEEDHLSFVGMTAPKFWGALKEKYGLKQSVEELVDNFRKISYEFFSSCEIEPMEGLLPFLEDLRVHGVKVALASSGSARRIGLIMKRLGLDEVFSVRVTANDVRIGKPDPEVFLKAAEKLGVVPADCAVIEDAKLGVEAANSAGMLSVGFNAVPGRQDLSAAKLIVGGFGELSYEKLAVFGKPAWI